MDPLAGMDDSSSDEDATSQASEATEDDPQVPEQQNAAPPPQPAPTPVRAAPPPPGTARERPNYELRQTMRGHKMSISAVKFSPDGQLLASCGPCASICMIPIRLFTLTSQR